MAETQTREQDTRDRARAATQEQTQAEPNLVFTRAATVQHPDTRALHHFGEGDAAPDWVRTVVAGDVLRDADAKSRAELRDLGPTPGFGQSEPNTPIGEDGGDVPSVSADRAEPNPEQHAQEIGLALPETGEPAETTTSSRRSKKADEG